MIRQKMTNLMALALMFSFAPMTAQADVIFDNGAPDFLNSWRSDVVSTSSGFVQQADDFTLGDDSVITDFHWWGTYQFLVGVTTTDNFTIEIYDDNGGSPALTPFYSNNVGNVDRVATGAIGGLNGYEYWVDIDPVPLDAGVQYWLSIYNNTPSVAITWLWAQSSQDGNVHGRVGHAGPWDFNPVELAFNLTDDGIIPEPATIMLMGLGLVGLGFARQRRNSA